MGIQPRVQRGSGRSDLLEGLGAVPKAAVAPEPGAEVDSEAIQISSALGVCLTCWDSRRRGASMTYLEAAAAVLKDAGGPLHYKAITARALERGLIEPKGATPDATMGAQLYQAVKHAETDGEPCVFRQTGRGHFALAAKAVSAELDADIAKHNGKLERELLDFLHEVHPKQVELLIGQLLTAIGFEDVAVTKYSGDGGIDVDATLTVGGVTRVRTAIQVKRWKNNVSGSTVRELRGS